MNQQLTRGIAWSVGMRWAMRVVGLVNVVILARLLAPDDFGVAAMATITYGLVEAFSEIGVQQHLIRSPDTSRAQADTAWTLRLLQQFIVALIILALAPLAARYFNEPRIVPVTWALAAGTVMAGFGNIGMVLARKELQFELDFRFHFYEKLFQFGGTIVLALILRNYWALILGHVVGSVASLILSYRMHPYRPRFSLGMAREYLRFGAAIVPQRLGKALHGRLDSIMVGGFADTTQMGLYNVASRMAEMSANELSVPVGRGLYPVLAKLVSRPKELAEAFTRVLSPISAIVVPITVTFWMVALDFVVVVFGERWVPAVPYMKWLIIYAAIESITMIMSQQILIVVGHERRAALFMWAKVCILAAFLMLGYEWRGLEGIAIMRPVVAALTFAIAAFLLTYSIPISMGTIAKALWRSVVSGLIAFLAVEFALMPLLEPATPIVRLAAVLPASVVAYVMATLILWLAAGRPPGVEEMLARRFALLRSRPHDE